MREGTQQQWDELVDAVSRLLARFNHAGALARHIDGWIAKNDPGLSWFWISNADSAGTTRSYLSISEDTRYVRAGKEQDFIAELRGQSAERSGNVHRFTAGWVVALGYEFSSKELNGSAELFSRTHPAPHPARAVALKAPIVIECVEDEPPTLRRVKKQHSSSAVSILKHLKSILEADPNVVGEDQQLCRNLAGTWLYSDPEYRARIRAAQRLIGDGDVSVLCLTNRATIGYPWETSNSETHRNAERMRSLALQTYLDLLQRSPAPRSGIISTPERVLVSASPERFISLHGARLSSAPIKGTRARGGTPREDAAIVHELATDTKEVTENSTIVNVMRNDFAGVCQPETVVTDSLCRVETYAQVHQLVSSISGTVRPGVDVWDVIQHVFPGGSMTGAPRAEAINCLRQLEGAERGLYSGCFGWVDDSGDAELAMTIRCVDFGLERAVVGAGGGITADSQPAREIDELHLKAKAILESLGTALR